MSVTNGIIKIPISLVDDIKPLLGVGGLQSNDLGYICSNQHGKINPWSKYKPVQYEQRFFQHWDSSQSMYVPDWYRGRDGNCGLNIQRCSTINNPQWTYEAPRGWDPNLEPYRLGDFADYNHNASPFFRLSFPLALSVMNGQSVILIREYEGTGRTGMLGIDDILVPTDIDETVPFKNFYFGLLFSSNRIITSSTRIGDNLDTVVEIPSSVLQEGDSLSITGCLSLTSLPNLTTAVPNTLWSLNYNLGGYENNSFRNYLVQSSTKYELIGVEFYNIEEYWGHLVCYGITFIFDSRNKQGGSFQFQFARISGMVDDDAGYVDIKPPGTGQLWTGSVPAGVAETKVTFQQIIEFDTRTVFPEEFFLQIDVYSPASINENWTVIWRPEDQGLLT